MRQNPFCFPKNLVTLFRKSQKEKAKKTKTAKKKMFSQIFVEIEFRILGSKPSIK